MSAYMSVARRRWSTWIVGEYCDQYREKKLMLDGRRSGFRSHLYMTVFKYPTTDSE